MRGDGGEAPPRPGGAQRVLRLFQDERRRGHTPLAELPTGNLSGSFSPAPLLLCSPSAFLHRSFNWREIREKLEGSWREIGEKLEGNWTELGGNMAGTWWEVFGKCSRSPLIMLELRSIRTGKQAASFYKMIE